MLTWEENKPQSKEDNNIQDPEEDLSLVVWFKLNERSLNHGTLEKPW